MRNLLVRILLASGFFALVMLVSPGSTNAEPQARPARQANLLQNPGFEEPYSGGIALSWSPWHQELNANPKPAECADYYLVRPSWSPEFNAAIILEGIRAQHTGNQFDTWRAGVFQNVPVNPGSTYRFTFWSTGRASNDQYPTPSDTSVSLGVRGGIDPNGSGLWSDGDIVWGASGSPHMSGGQGNWQQFSVEATATAGQITVFVQGDTGGANNCRAHLDVWFDKAELVEAGPPPTNTRPPAPPQPVITNTPRPPAETPAPEVSPTNTLVPTETPTNTPVPPETGIICANAFADANGNGQRDLDEGYMAGVTLTVGQGGQFLGNGVSTGTDTAICFENLLPGDYVVAQQIPRHLVMTTAPSATVAVTAGTTISLEFGSWFRGDAEELATATPEAGDGNGDGSSGGSSGDGPNILAIVGLGAIALAILLMGAVIFILLRQQSGRSGKN